MDLATMILACSLYNDNSLMNAMVQVGSQNNALMITLEGSNPTVFPTLEKANSYAKDEISQGKVVDIGLMQIPSSWLKQYHVKPADILLPCKNIAVASQILSDALNSCTSTITNKNTDVRSCALSMYKTGNATSGLDYAHKVLSFAADNPFVKPPSTENATPAPTPPAHTTPPKKHVHKPKHHKHKPTPPKAEEVTPAPTEDTVPLGIITPSSNAT